MTRKGLSKLLSAVAACTAMVFAPAGAQEVKPIKIGFVTFLSGPPAGAFGVPARNGAEVTSRRSTPAACRRPTPARASAARRSKWCSSTRPAARPSRSTSTATWSSGRASTSVIGYISSGDCLAVAPLAEELKKLTVFFDCGTPRIFEDASYKYLFRTGATGTMDNTAAALYVTEMKPQAKTHRGHQPELRVGPGLVERLRGWR